MRHSSPSMHHTSLSMYRTNPSIRQTSLSVHHTSPSMHHSTHHLQGHQSQHHSLAVTPCVHTMWIRRACTSKHMHRLEDQESMHHKRRTLTCTMEKLRIQDYTLLHARWRSWVRKPEPCCTPPWQRLTLLAPAHAKVSCDYMLDYLMLTTAFNFPT
jgi:hypothetical protein